MKEKRYYQVLILLLIVLNIAILGFVWKHGFWKSDRGNGGRPAEFVIRELNLTESQKRNFFLLREDHARMMKQLSGEDKILHKKFFDLLQAEAPDSAARELYADSMASIRKKMELATFEHFVAIKKILDPQQKLKFTKMFHELIRGVLPPQEQRPGNKPPRDPFSPHR
jgi:Spy/CpxP family protein refolding chaperone